MTQDELRFVSRGGLKLAAALDAFTLDPAGRTCADLGCNVGGFTDCLLQRGAARVYAVDTGYGALAWKLRNDPRVTVMERTNAIHFDPGGLPKASFVAIDLGWTRQAKAVPAALRWLDDSPEARIVTLIKPHYEADKQELARGPAGGILTDQDAAGVAQRVMAQLSALGVTVLGSIPSPIRGGAGKGKSGNMEFLTLLSRTLR